jgi:drug/metabolite transporter, DME family
VLGLRWLHEGGLRIVVLGNWLTFLVALPFAWPVPAMTATDIASLVYLGVFQIGLAYVCLTKALTRIPAFEAATLLLVEPAMNPVWTWLSLGERPAALSIAGGVVILASTLVNTWIVSRSSRGET